MEGEGYQLKEKCTAFCGLSVNDVVLKEELFGVFTYLLTYSMEQSPS
jgi:hypothetical protein